eukprot:gene3565-4009_t
MASQTDASIVLACDAGRRLPSGFVPAEPAAADPEQCQGGLCVGMHNGPHEGGPASYPVGDQAKGFTKVSSVMTVPDLPAKMDGQPCPYGDAQQLSLLPAPSQPHFVPFQSEGPAHGIPPHASGTACAPVHNGSPAGICYYIWTGNIHLLLLLLLLATFYYFCIWTDIFFGDMSLGKMNQFVPQLILGN